ncbi:hypothetical protein [Bremerella sp. P1]|uniref:hypothetical protein n=1 Tax=Bremerella sp. P1 TaxID=3026424 RepID=UPI002367C9C8|nr:hypothetical protein [Bremerella sp. P1]WDI42187.1 hypothetical protein PSR63_27430 [Bremerella sp. P1]
MTLNPYSLPNPKDHDRYFTDDITLLPVGIIWQSLQGQSIFLRTLFFVYFVVRKLFRQRMPASYGTHYPPTLTETTEEHLPDDARQALTAFDHQCQAAGMEHVGYFLPSWIGGKSGVVSISLDHQRMVWCTANWLEIRVGQYGNARVVFACHSETADGTELHTSVETAELWIPQMIPSNVQIDRIPRGSTVADIIEHHQTSVADRTDLVAFDNDSLIAHIQRRSLELIDFMVSKGFYVELTADEIDRLRRTSVGGASQRV